MRHTITSLVALMGAAAIVSAQWSQPWTSPRASFESRVVSTANLNPMNRIAYDDFQLSNTTTFHTRLTWWGVLNTTAQINGKYYVAIYKNNPLACRPNLSAKVYQAILNPEEVFAGLDCQGKNVYRMFAPLPSPFVAIGGQRYWLEIAEIDSLSARIGIEDFRWSGRRPILLCPAVQLTAAGVWVSPLKDPCDQIPDDLSFVLTP